MKKTLAILLVLMLALSLLAACGSKTETPAPEPEVESVEPAAEETAEEPAEEPEEEPAEEPAEEPEEEPAEEPVEEPEEEPAGEPSGEPTEEPAEAPEAPELSGVIVPAGEYTYTENTPFGAYPWVLTLNEDGTYSVMQDNPDMGSPTWTGDQWVDNGDGTVTTPDGVGDGPQIASFWDANSTIVWRILNEGRAVPVKAPEYAADVETYGLFTEGAEEAPAAGGAVEAGEYGFVEATPFGNYPWVVTLNEDGSFVVMQDNPDMGSPTWTGDQWVDNGDGTFTVQDCVGDGPQIASFWKNNSITFTLEADGSITPVG